MKLLIILFTILTTLNCEAQERETVYLVFKENFQDNCEHSAYRDGRKKETISFKHKKRKLTDKIIFKMCYAQFKYSSKIKPKIIKDIVTLNIVNINYMYSEIEKDWPKTAKEVHFEKIYILEKEDDGTYLQYEVKWTDEY